MPHEYIFRIQKNLMKSRQEIPLQQTTMEISGQVFYYQSFHQKYTGDVYYTKNIYDSL